MLSLLLLPANLLSTIVILLNSVLFVVMTESSSLALWFVLFEVSLASVLASLTLEGRGYRRLYALISMMSFSFLATGIFITLTNLHCHAGVGLEAITLLGFVIFATKVPLFPFSM